MCLLWWVSAKRRKIFLRRSLNMMSTNLILTAIHWTKNAWTPTHGKLKQQRSMRCLPSRETLSMKSDAICQIKWCSCTFHHKLASDSAAWLRSPFFSDVVTIAAHRDLPALPRLFVISPLKPESWLTFLSSAPAVSGSALTCLTVTRIRPIVLNVTAGGT